MPSEKSLTSDLSVKFLLISHKSPEFQEAEMWNLQDLCSERHLSDNLKKKQTICIYNKNLS